MSNIRIFTATQKDDIKETNLYSSILNKYHHILKWKCSNKTFLPKLYNEQIDKAIKDSVDYLVLVHDDVHINCSDLLERVSKYGEQFTVFGLAGTKAITVKEPVLWHLMSDRSNLRGCVAHGTKTAYAYTSFGPLPSKVVMIDGVFICINIKKLPDNIKFDENCPSGFHFYDLIFSLDCSIKKIDVGVGDVPIIHESPGLKEMSDDWKQGQKYFLNKYNLFLNKTLTV